MLDTETLTSKAPNGQAKVVTFENARQWNNIAKFGNVCKMPEFGFRAVKFQGVGMTVRQAKNTEKNVPPVD